MTLPALAVSTMIATFYWQGTRTASGERFDPDGLTAAHRTLAFGTHLRVCYRGCAVVRINDRGPAVWTGAQLDLSRGAANAIGLTLHIGKARVRVSKP